MLDITAETKEKESEPTWQRKARSFGYIKFKKYRNDKDRVTHTRIRKRPSAKKNTNIEIDKQSKSNNNINFQLFRITRRGRRRDRHKNSQTNCAA